MASNGKTEQPRFQLKDHACLMDHHNNRILQLIWRHNASTFTSAEWMVGQWLMDRGQVMHGLFLIFQSDCGFSWCVWFFGAHQVLPHWLLRVLTPSTLEDGWHHIEYIAPWGHGEYE